MAVSVNWGTKIIYVPKADLTLVQSTPTEIREMDINWFRLQLKDLEDSAEGIWALDTHTHNTEVSLGGLTYARVVEIINGYTVTFEDGQYAVNLTGANSNIGDKVNVNQVSVRSANSAGLISNPAIEYASFNGGVTIDVVNGTTGTIYNVGTPQNPVNNLDDALLIAEYRGFNKLLVIGDLEIPPGADVSDFEIEGQSQVKTVISISAGAETEGLEVYNSTVSGTLDGNSFIEDCIVQDLHYINGYIKRCGLVGDIVLDGDRDSVFPDCYTPDQDDPPVIDMGGSGNSLALPNYSGIVSIKNLSDSDQEIGVGINAGLVVLEDTITAGTIIVSGSGLLYDYSSGAAVVNTDGLMSKATISEAVLNTSLVDFTLPNTVAESLKLSAYDYMVSIDVNTTTSGTAFPAGTVDTPVNNLADAVTIAEGLGYNTLNFKSDFTFEAGTILSNYKFIGQSHATTLTFEEGSIQPYSSCENATMTGKSLGITDMSNVVHNNYGASSLIASDKTIVLKDSLIIGETYIPSNFTGIVYVIDCRSGGDTEAAAPVMNTNGAACTIIVRNFNGATKVINASSVDARYSYDFNSGTLILDSTCISGSADVRGVGKLIDNSGPGFIVDSEGLMAKDTISQAVWDEPIEDHLIAGSTGRSIGIQQYAGVITVDTTTSTSGISFPNGTRRVPVNNMADALSIANSTGIQTIYALSDITVASGQNVDEFLITASNFQEVTVEAGASLVDTIFEKVSLYGVMGAYWNVINDCWIYDITNFCGWVRGGSSFASIELAPYNEDSAGESFFDDIVPIAPGVPSVLTMNTDVNVSFTEANDTYEIKEMTDGSALSMGLSGGTLIINSDCVGGDITVLGTGDVFNNSLLTYDDAGLMSKETISEAVWDEPIEDHLIAGTTGISIGIQQFGGFVTVSSGTTNSGTTFPTGTARVPVNNIEDALVIANTWGLDKIHFDSNYTITSGTLINDMSLYGESYNDTTITFEAGCLLPNCKLFDLKATGDIIGAGTFERTFLEDLGNYTPVVVVSDIYVYNSVLKGTLTIPYLFGGTIQCYNSFSTPSDTGTPPILDMNGASCNLDLKQHSGGLTIKNCTDADNLMKITLNGGTVVLDSSITAGKFSISGVGILIDNSTSVTSLNTDGLMSKDTIGVAIWDEPIADHLLPNTMGHQMYHEAYGGIVHINTVSGVAGTTFPTGTTHQPCDNLTDALTIATTHFMDTIHIIGSLTMNGEDITGFTIGADRSLGNTLTIDSMTNTGACYFEDLTVAGNLTGQVRFTACVLGALDNFAGGAKNCLLTNDITISGSGANYFTDCDTYISDIDSFVDISVGDNRLNIIRGRGNYQISNKTGGTYDTYIDLVGGNISVADTCTAGIIKVDGIAYVIDNSGAGCTVDISNAIDSRYTADYVWNETLADHTTAGTYGAELATKADIISSVSTDYDIATSGSIVYGNLVAGTISSTEAQDGTYWQIQEDATDGLTVEFTFNIPDDNRPGSINVFGRYEGVPSTAHYIDLYAYNYQATAWEILLTEFMPGGNTTDDTFMHEYYEKHVDRNNNNEVKIRLVHSVATYNATHNIYLDLVELTSIHTVTAELIADAVWDEPAADHTTAGSTGESLDNASAGGDLTDIENTLSDIETGLTRVLGLVQENQYLDQTVYANYNGQKLLTSGRIRTYSDAASVGTSSNVIATYQITASWTGDEMTSYKMVKV